MMNDGVEGPVAPMAGRQPGIEPEGIKGQPEAFDSKLFGILHQNRKDCRVQMQMQMAIDMIERELRSAKFFELRVNLGPQLLAQAPPEEIAKTRRRGAVGEFLLRVDEARDAPLRQCGVTEQQRQMEPYPQPGILAS